MFFYLENVPLLKEEHCTISAFMCFVASLVSLIYRYRCGSAPILHWMWNFLYSAYSVSIDEQYFRRLLYSHHSWVFIPQSTELLNFQAFSGTMKLISDPFHTQLCKRYTKVFFFFLEFCEAKTKIWFLNLVSVTFRFWDVWFLELFPKPPNWIFLI